MAKRIVLSGYATVDYLLTTDAEPTGFGTWPARLSNDDGWPRAGGAPLYAGTRLAAHGMAAMPLVAIAPDTNGGIYQQACARAGIDDTAIATTAARTACCVLAQHPSGRYLCLLDAGQGIDGALTPAQEHAVATADLVCVTAAPPRQTTALLTRLRPDQRLAWIAKADPACFPPDLCRRLSDRADILFYNCHERDLIGSVRRPGSIAVETRGQHGAIVTTPSARIELTITAVRCADATGCGDTFAGEFIAQILSEKLPHIAAKLASNSVHQLLTHRNSK